jgi:hypothetical protein
LEKYANCYWIWLGVELKIDLKRINKKRKSGRLKPYSISSDSLDESRNKVFSYSTSGIDLETSDLKNGRSKLLRHADLGQRHNKTMRFHRLPAVICTLAVVGALGYSTMLTKAANINLVLPENLKGKIDETKYSTSIRGVMDASIVSKNKLTINTRRLESDISNLHPELSSVSIGLPMFGRNAIVTARIASPQYAIVSTAGAPKMLMDDRGVIIMPADSLQVRGGLLEIVDETDSRPEQGRQYLAEKDVSFITTFVGGLKEKGINISSMRLPPIAGEIHFYIKGQPYFIKANFNQGFRSAGPSLR